MRASIDTDPAAHALLPIQGYAVRFQSVRVEGAHVYTGPAGSAQTFVHLHDIAGRSKRGDAILHHGFNPCTAAFAAIADGIEPIKHGILEPGGMHMTTVVLGLQEFQRLWLREALAPVRVMFQHKISERLADDHTYPRGFAVLGT